MGTVQQNRCVVRHSTSMASERGDLVFEPFNNYYIDNAIFQIDGCVVTSEHHCLVKCMRCVTGTEQVAEMFHFKLP